MKVQNVTAFVGFRNPSAKFFYDFSKSRYSVPRPGIKSPGCLKLLAGFYAPNRWMEIENFYRLRLKKLQVNWTFDFSEKL